VPLVATERDNVPSLLSDPSRSGRDSIPGEMFFREPSGDWGIFRLNRVVESKKFVTRAIRCIEKVCTKFISFERTLPKSVGVKSAAKLPEHFLPAGRGSATLVPKQCKAHYLSRNPHWEVPRPGWL